MFFIFKYDFNIFLYLILYKIYPPSMRKCVKFHFLIIISRYLEFIVLIFQYVLVISASCIFGSAICAIERNH